MIPRRLLIVALVVAAFPRGAAAQDVWAGAALHYDGHRFDEAPESDRLDGAAAGVSVLGGVRWNHLAARVEWAPGRDIEDLDTFSLDLGGRTVTIQSSFTHRIDVVRVLGGFTHALSSRARIAYLAGAAFTRAERTFTTNAPGVILGPSAPSPTTSDTERDRFTAFAGGVDAIVRVRAGLHALTGIRLQSLSLEPEISGRSLNAFAGLAWVF